MNFSKNTFQLPAAIKFKSLCPPKCFTDLKISQMTGDNQKRKVQNICKGFFFLALKAWKSKLNFAVYNTHIFFKNKNIKMKVDCILMLRILKLCLMYQHI